MKLSEQLCDVSAKATGGEWCKSYYDCGDVSYYDHNGPCPGIFSDEHDCGIIHWDGFKQEYWSACNGDQKQIDANADLIALMCSESNRNHIIAALEAYERGPTPEQVREACARVCADTPMRIKGILPGMADGAVSAANQIEAAIRALDLSKIGGE